MAPYGGSTTFKVTANYDADYCKCSFTEYESQTTGMRVVVVDSPGPKVSGYFALATEIHDDSGAPHTLEHLIFMGSRSYPYKGFLDKLATRAFSYTNAWTGNDQTVYTLETAGWDGFNQMLPVYLDHVVQPTLTDAACLTEVHHIDGAGNDAGVVYSEMQGRQNTQYDLIELERNRLLYPESVGFRYETGGLMDALRVLPADRIRAFHKERYQPKNLSVIIIGTIDHKQLLESLERFEETLHGKVPKYSDNFDRPWVKQGKTAPLQASMTKYIEFPDDDESTGEICISYLGPDYHDAVGQTAVDVLLVYLAGSPISQLNDILVEKENLASSVSGDTEVRPDLLIDITIEGVETEKLDLVKNKVLNLLSEAGQRELDMEYLRQCLERTERQTRSVAEKTPSSFHQTMIEQHLFGHRGQPFDHVSMKEYAVLATWSEEKWRSFFCHWFVERHHVCVIAKPSLELSKQLEAAEVSRVEARKKEIGEEGLEKLQRKLLDAQKENEQEVPADLMRQFQPPKPDSVKFVETSTAFSGLAQQGKKPENSAQAHVDQDTFGSPLFIHFESVPSAFVRLNVSLCTNGLPEEQRPLVPILLANFFDTPVNRHGQRMEYDKVQAELESDTISFSADRFFANAEMINIRFLFEPSKYEKIIDWLETLLLDRIHDPARLDGILRKLLADIPEEKRGGAEMAESVNNIVLLSRKSTYRALTTLGRSQSQKGFLRLIKRDPEQAAHLMTTMTRALIRPDNIRVNVIADLESDSRLPCPRSTLEKFAKRLDLAQPKLVGVDNPAASLSQLGQQPGSQAYLVPQRSSDSSYAILTAKGVGSLNDAVYPALSVAQEYLDACEGPMWNAVRGSGLAYGTGFRVDESRGLTKFRIYRSTDALKALKTAKQTVESIASGETEIDRFDFEGALSSIVVRMADEQPNMVDAAIMAYDYESIKGVGKHWPKEFLKAVQGVTPEDMRQAIKDVLLPVFDPASSVLVVTCATGMTEKLEAGLSGLGYNVSTKPVSFFEDDYGFLDGEAGEDEEGDSLDGDDDDEDEDEDAEMDSEEDG